MYFFGHVGVILFLSFMLFLPMIFALIGAVLPDVIDKSLYFLGFAPSGRYIAHTLFFVVVAGLAVYFITRKKSVALALSFGLLLHLFGDATYFVPWFYPFIDYNFKAYPIELKLDPFLIFSEIVGLALLFAIVKYGSSLDIMRNKMRSKLRKWLNIGRH